MIHPLFTIDKLRRLHMFSDVLDFIETVRSIYQNVQYFVRSKNCVSDLAAVTYSRTSAVKRNYAKNTIQRLPVTCFPAHRSSWKQKTCHRVVWLISYSGELCNRNCIVKTSETLIIWSTFCYTAGFHKTGCNKSGARLTDKRMVMVFRVHSRPTIFLLPTDPQRWLSIWRGLCTFIERDA